MTTTDVTDHIGTKEINSVLDNKLVLPIAGLGLVLRVWDLGSKNFWLDELGVANAAFQPTLSQALKAANEHIMAMPLDYVVAWAVARFSHTEGWLRLPAAIWGFLTLLAGYKLCLKVSADKRVALFGLLITALSPILIAYSQELRFYAPLVFFYTLSTYLGLKAVQKNQVKDWSLFTLAAGIGMYFHLYTILALGNVFLWLSTYFEKDDWKKRRDRFALSAFILAIAFLIGLFTFGGVYAERRISLFMYEPFSTFLLAGLGWKPPFPASPIAWVLGLLSMGFAAVGVVATIKKNRFGLSAILFYSAVLQVILVIGFNYLRNYFLHARQIIMLVPIMIYFCASGVIWTVDQITTYSNISRQRSWVTALFAVVFVIAAIPALNEYYQAKKGSLWDIHAMLSNRWHMSEPIHVEAGILEVYAYYWKHHQEDQSLVQALTPLDYDSPNGWDYPKPAWFITGYPPMPGTETALRSAGFVPVYTPAHNTVHPQMLWHRE